jgi:hypothetical protein
MNKIQTITFVYIKSFITVVIHFCKYKSVKIVMHYRIRTNKKKFKNSLKAEQEKFSRKDIGKTSSFKTEIKF